MAFDHFPPETVEFLRAIRAHNNRDWFEAHRADYTAFYVAPAQDFVETLGPRLRKVSPTVQFQPRVNASLVRINRDIRFAKDKSPYKDHIDIWFWHGDNRGWDCPGFFFRLSPDAVWIGAGMHMMEKDRLARARSAIVAEKSGRALAALIAKLEKAGCDIGDKTLARVPRGFDAGHPRAELLKFTGLHAGMKLPAAEAAKPGFAALCLRHFKKVWPVGKWLLEET